MTDKTPTHYRHQEETFNNADHRKRGLPWEDWEHNLAANYNLSAKDVADRTGRTYFAVTRYRARHGFHTNNDKE